MTRNLKFLSIALLAIIIIGGVYAFAAANTVPDSNAGYKANVVPGYTVTNIVYDLNATDPTTIDNITFNIAGSGGNTAAAVTVMIQTANAGSWKTCGVAAGAVTCDYTSAPINVVDVTALNIVATSSSNP